MIKQNLKDILFIIGSMKSRIPLMIFLYLSSSFLELLGLSLVVPYLSAIQAPEQLEQFSLWVSVENFLNFQNHIDALIFLSLVILIIFGTKIALYVFIQNSIIVFSYDLQVTLRKRLARAYIHAPYTFHTKKRSSEVISVMQNHVNQFSKGVVGSLLRLCGEITTVFFIGLFLLISYPISSLVALSFIVLFLFVCSLKIKARLRQYGKNLVLANNDLIRSTTQGVKGIKEAKVIGNTSFFENAIIDSAQRSATINSKIAFLQILPRFILEFLIISVIILTVIMNMIIYGEDAQVINNLVVFAAASLRLLPSASQIASNLNTLYYAAPMKEEILSDIKTTGDGKNKPFEKISAEMEQLKLENLSFSYPNSDKIILDNINLEIKKGEIIGIFGESGSGKTTLINIILGLLDFEKGSLTFNGKKITQKEWSKLKIASYISQTPLMIDDRIILNVAIGEEIEKIDVEKVIYSLKKAHIFNWVNDMPEKTNTLIGEDAQFMSGGQKQRLAISRSFYFNRDLIIFDEVTSALDENTEKEVLADIKKLKKDSAVLIISHSPETMNICDRIFYIKNGKLIKNSRK